MPAYDHANKTVEYAVGAFAVTPNDSTDLTVHSRALHVGTQGNVKVTMATGDTVTFTAALGILPVRVSRVWDTGTTASGITGLY